MTATKQITDILSACGCKPAATVDNNGNAVIKVNAPAITPAKYYTVRSWADSQNISDILNYHKITFELYVISWAQCRIEINAGDLKRAEKIFPYPVEWKEV
jgi:hypothetical protein